MKFNLGFFIVSFVFIFLLVGANAEMTWGEDINVPFSVSGGDFYCEDGHWTNGEPNCFNESGWDEHGSLVACCPVGEHCDIETSICGESYVVECDDYKNEDDCIGFERNVGIYTVEKVLDMGAGFCSLAYPFYKNVYVRNCGCEWDGTDSVCKGSYDELDGKGGKIGKCVFTVGEIEDGCVDGGNGLYGYDLTAAWMAGTGNTLTCKDKSVSVDCGSRLLQLPFFNWINIVLVVLIIGIFYLVWKSRKDVKKSVKKSVKKKSVKKK